VLGTLLLRWAVLPGTVPYQMVLNCAEIWYEAPGTARGVARRPVPYWAVLRRTVPH